MKTKPKAVLAAIVMTLIPQLALAAGLSEFSGPLQQLTDTITGPVGRYSSIIAMALVGVTFIFKREEISGVFKSVLGVVFAICLIVFASSMVESMFAFNSGAVL